MSRQGKRRKLMSPWTGPWRVSDDDKEHVYAVQLFVELRDVHVVTMRFYVDDQLEITVELLKVSLKMINQANITSAKSR